jgi:hypothetical protein
MRKTCLNEKFENPLKSFFSAMKFLFFDPNSMSSLFLVEFQKTRPTQARFKAIIFDFFFFVLSVVILQLCFVENQTLFSNLLAFSSSLKVKQVAHDANSNRNNLKKRIFLVWPSTSQVFITNT